MTAPDDTSRPVRRALARLGGADDEILALCANPAAEEAHYARIGAALVLPFLLTAAGVGVIGHIVTGRPAIDVQLAVVAVAWGATVAFFLDPLLLRSTLDLRPRGAELDGKRHRRLSGSGTMVFLRFGLSIATAIAVAEPLMTVVFAGAIADGERAAELRVFAQEGQVAMEERLATSLEEQRSGLAENVTVLEDDESEARTAATIARQLCDDETDGDNGGDPGVGPQADLLCGVADEREAELEVAIQNTANGQVFATAAEADFDSQRKAVADDIEAARKEIRDRSDAAVLSELGVWERVERMHAEVGLWMLLVVGALFFFADVAAVAYKQFAPPREHDLIAARRRAERWITEQTAVANDAVAMDRAHHERHRRAREDADQRAVDEVQMRTRLRKEEITAEADVEIHALEEADRVDAQRAEVERRRLDRWWVPEPVAEPVPGGPGPEVVDVDPDGDEPDVGPDGDEPDTGSDGDEPDGEPDGEEQDADATWAQPDFGDLDRIQVGGLAIELDGGLIVGGQGLLRPGRILADHGTAPVEPRYVMVKVPNPDASVYGDRPGGPAGAGASLLEEIETYGDLVSWTIANRIAFDPSRARPALVLELLPRRSLDRWLFGPGGVPFDVEAWVVTTWLWQVAKAHGALWPQQLANTDARMANYLVRGELTDEPLGFRTFGEGIDFKRRRDAGRLVLCDLGGVGSVGSAAIEWTPVNTPPEWRRGVRTASYAGNIYVGLGLFAIDLLAGGRSLRSPEGLPPPVRDVNPAVPEPLAVLVDDFLVPDPVERMARLGLGGRSATDGGSVALAVLERIEATYRRLAVDGVEWDVVLEVGAGRRGEVA